MSPGKLGLDEGVGCQNLFPKFLSFAFFDFLTKKSLLRVTHDTNRYSLVLESVNFHLE